MSFEPTHQPVGDIPTRSDRLRIAAASAVCLLLYVYFFLVAHAVVNDHSMASRRLAWAASFRIAAPSQALPPLQEHRPARFASPASDHPSLTLETEDVDSGEEESAHFLAFLDARPLPLGELSRQDALCVSFPPFPAVLGLMSRRF